MSLRNVSSYGNL